MAKARSAYRALVRAIHRHLSTKSDSQWQQYARAEFSKHNLDWSPQELDKQLQLAEDYTLLINSIRDHKVRLIAAPNLLLDGLEEYGLCLIF